MTDYLALAREAAIESHGKLAVGEFSHTVQEDQDGVLTYLFESKLKGYPDWNIAVTLYIDGWNASVSEVVLAPSESSLVAPKWVPWSERLADYKALQAALEAEAAAAAALAAESDEDEDLDEDLVDDADDSTDVSDAAVGEIAFDDEPEIGEQPEEPEFELAVADVPEAVEAKDDSDTAGSKSKGLFKWKTLRGKKKHK